MAGGGIRLLAGTITGTMRTATHTRQHETNPTLLEMVLRLEGDFRRNLEPLRVTPLQAGALIFIHRHANATLTDAAASLGIRLPTLSTLVKALMRKRWVTKRYSIEDRRAMRLALSRRGCTLALNIEQRVRQVETTLVKQYRGAIGMNLKGSRT